MGHRVAATSPREAEFMATIDVTESLGCRGYVGIKAVMKLNTIPVGFGICRALESRHQQTT